MNVFTKTSYDNKRVLVNNDGRLCFLNKINCTIIDFKIPAMSFIPKDRNLMLTFDHQLERHTFITSRITLVTKSFSTGSQTQSVPIAITLKHTMVVLDIPTTLSANELVGVQATLVDQTNSRGYSPLDVSVALSIDV